jgi:KUP system potassium uptake protein
VVAIGLLIQMATWRKGRQLVAARIQRGERTVDEVFAEAQGLVHVDGCAVFLFKDPGKAPPALINNLRHNKVLHERTILLAIVTTDAPQLLGDERRATVEALRPGVWQVVVKFGYMEDPDVPAALSALAVDGAPLLLDEVSYFVGRESVYQGDLEGMHPAFEHLYTLLHRGADSASRFFRLPRDRVFEVGALVEL